MKQTIAGFTNEKLEQEIANCYVSAHREAPGVRVNEEKHPFLGDLWNEFEIRIERGTIAADSDYEPKQWREGYYE